MRTWYYTFIFLRNEYLSTHDDLVFFFSPKDSREACIKMDRVAAGNFRFKKSRRVSIYNVSFSRKRNFQDTLETRRGRIKPSYSRIIIEIFQKRTCSPQLCTAAQRRWKARFLFFQYLYIQQNRSLCLDTSSRAITHEFKRPRINIVSPN